MAFTVQVTGTTPVYRSPTSTGVFVQWTVTSPPPLALTFALERSGSPGGPYESVVSNLTSYHFFDVARDQPAPATGTRENLNFLSLSRGVSYRVTVTASDGSTASTVYTLGPTAQLRKLELLRRKMQRDLGVSFKFNGINLALLKRKHWGLRCTDCFDLLTKRVTKSKCTTCYGTGFEGGYYDPVRVRGRIGVKNVQTQMQTQGKVDTNRRSLTLLSYPELEVDDLIVDLAQNERYVVLSRHSTELQTVAVHQSLVLSDLARDSVEYRLAVNTDHSPMIY